MVKEEERIFQGIVFCPGDPELVALKLRTHNLNVDYNNTYEDEYEKRAAILGEILGEMGRAPASRGPSPSTMASTPKSAGTFSATST